MNQKQWQIIKNEQNMQNKVTDDKVEVNCEWKNVNERNQILNTKKNISNKGQYFGHRRKYYIAFPNDGNHISTRYYKKFTQFEQNLIECQKEKIQTNPFYGQIQHLQYQLNQENLDEQGQFKQIYTRTLKFTQSKSILSERIPAVQANQTVWVFVKIHVKIIQAFLKQMSNYEKKTKFKNYTFQNIQLLRNLSLEASSITPRQMINRANLNDQQKNWFLNCLSIHKQVGVFLDLTLINGYQEINNQFIMLNFMIQHQLEQRLQNNRQNNNLQNKQFDQIFHQKPIFSVLTKQSNQSSNERSQFLIKKNEFLVIKQDENPLSKLLKQPQQSQIDKKQQAMKRYLQLTNFTGMIYNDSRFKYLNFRSTQLFISDERACICFKKLIKLYSHLIIKLMCLEQAIQSQKHKNTKINKSQQQIKDLSTNNTQSEIAINNDYQSQLMNKWLAPKDGFKSFDSINSLSSINLNNLTDIKNFNSKEDLWSDQSSSNYSFQKIQQKKFIHKKPKQ